MYVHNELESWCFKKKKSVMTQPLRWSKFTEYKQLSHRSPESVALAIFYSLQHYWCWVGTCFFLKILDNEYVIHT